MNLFSQRCAILAVLLVICGCYSPYQNRGWLRPQGYYPTQPGQFQTPGQLYVPPSNDPLGAPGTPAHTYDDTDQDDFKKDGGGSFFPEDGGVPAPQSRGTGSFDSDF